jgi:hypothetical protein
MLFNLVGEFQRACGLTSFRQLASLRATAWAGLEGVNSLFKQLLLYEIPTSRKLEIQPHAAD